MPGNSECVNVISSHLQATNDSMYRHSSPWHSMPPGIQSLLVWSNLHYCLGWSLRIVVIWGPSHNVNIVPLPSFSIRSKTPRKSVRKNFIGFRFSINSVLSLFYTFLAVVNYSKYTSNYKALLSIKKRCSDDRTNLSNESITNALHHSLTSRKDQLHSSLD